jgi:hypothetical protein
MKLKNYIKELAKLAKKYPNATVVSASDEEGNAFSEVIYSPSVGKFDGREFDDDVEPNRVNAVCIN